MGLLDKIRDWWNGNSGSSGRSGGQPPDRRIDTDTWICPGCSRQRNGATERICPRCGSRRPQPSQFSVANWAIGTAIVLVLAAGFIASGGLEAIPVGVGLGGGATAETATGTAVVVGLAAAGPATAAPASTPTPTSPTTTPAPMPPPTSAAATPQPTPATKSYRLTKAEVTRSYGKNIEAHAIQPGTQNCEQGPYTFGWGFPWGANNVNRNYCTDTLTVTEFPAVILPGKEATFKAVMKGDWDTTGYAVDRDMHIAASGVFGAGSYYVRYTKTPSGKYQGAIDLTNKYTLPADQRGPLVLTANAELVFGEDHGARMQIKFTFEEQP
jgi:hypothetical protein